MMLLLTLYVMFLTSNIESKYAGDSCFDENGVGGTYTILSQCRHLIHDILRAGSPMPRFMVKRLHKLTCGFDDDSGEPLVCCASSPIYTLPTSTINGIIIPNQKKPNTESKLLDTNIGNNRKNGPQDVQRHPNLSLLPKNCGEFENYKIIRGNMSDLFDFPWIVQLSYETGNETRISCGGSIINEWYILTAARCVYFLRKNITLTNVILGEFDMRTNPDCAYDFSGSTYCASNITTIRVAEVIPHEGYRPNTNFDDIALIRLSKPANFSVSDSIQPICLPITRDLQQDLAAGLQASVAGWGITEMGPRMPVMHNADLSIISNKDCQTAFNGSLRIFETQLCASAGTEIRDSCAGDSGGPLTYPGNVAGIGFRQVQRGIVSSGSKGCGMRNLPGVYTKVAYYMDWILDHIHS